MRAMPPLSQLRMIRQQSRTRRTMPRRRSDKCASLCITVFAASVALDAEEPGRKRRHRLQHRTSGRGSMSML